MNASEMKALRKDGTTFHINLSISEGRVGGKTFCAAFIRDTEMKERIDKLLGSILPKSIAEVLQQDIDNPNRPLIAEGYKDVTILFADIVGFTSMSSNISPRELIFMLNTIFSEWDSLCEKWHLEKIKTVGGKEKFFIHRLTLQIATCALVVYQKEHSIMPKMLSSLPWKCLELWTDSISLTTPISASVSVSTLAVLSLVLSVLKNSLMMYGEMQ